MEIQCLCLPAGVSALLKEVYLLNNNNVYYAPGVFHVKHQQLKWQGSYFDVMIMKTEEW